MKLKSKIIMCVFIFAVGTAVNVVWSNVMNASIKKIPFGSGFFNLENLLKSIQTDEQLGKLFFLFEGVVLLLCMCYFFLSQRPYQAKTHKVTDEITIPIPYGQGQHGTAWFMDKKAKRYLDRYKSVDEFVAKCGSSSDEGISSAIQSAVYRLILDQTVDTLKSLAGSDTLADALFRGNYYDDGND